MKPNKQLSIEEFGKQLLETNDLDPVYVMLHHADLEPNLLFRWLLAYWCFYHSGTSSWICSGPTGVLNYWIRMSKAAESKEYPRAHERRHFRGENAKKSVKYLQQRGLIQLQKDCTDVPIKPAPVSLVMERVQKWVGFGPWVAFKVADMLERLGLLEVQFNDAAAFLFDSPKEGAERLWGVKSDAKVPDNVGSWALGYLVYKFSVYKAPPNYDRPIGFQEAETILCKWKSHTNGHYTVGEDIEALRNGLKRFAGSSMTFQLKQACVRGGLWNA